MRFVGAEELREACDLAALVGALEDGHLAGKPEVTDGLIGPERARYLIRSSHDGLKLFGSKLITIVPDNPDARGMPSVQAVIVLFDGENGTPRAALDATELTYWKTAADSALGSKYLSRSGALTLLIVGAGGLAPWLVRGHRTVRPALERVLVWNRTRKRAEALVRRLRKEDIPAEVSNTLQEAVAEADIVCTATMAKAPILKGSWLTPGTHVDLVGGYSLETREADDATLRRGKVYVDCRESAFDGVGDIAVPLRDGVIFQTDIVGDLFDLVDGSVPGRIADEEITVYKNAGGAHLDLMIAAALLDRLEVPR